jgi:glycosyltransferase involved in cell wall biosynthesis
MRCLIVSCVFPPEPVVSARTSRDVAETMAERGHEVTVIAPFPNRPAGRVYPGFRRKWRDRRKESRGFEVVRCLSAVSRRPSLASRLLESVSFAMSAGWTALVSRHPSIIYANTWPILGTGVLLTVARLRGIPLVINVQDLYPESLVSQNRIARSGPAARWLRRLDGFIARHSAAVVLVSDRFLSVYGEGRGVDTKKIHVIPNWGTVSEEFPSEEKVAQFRERTGIPQDAFVVGFGGNISTAAGVETLLEAFAHLESVQNCYLLVAGEGSNLKGCRGLAARLGIDRVRFLSPWPADETLLTLRSSDLLVVPTRAKQSEVSAPSKVLAYLSAGRPVLAAAVPGSVLASIVEESGAGWVVEPERPEAMAAKIWEILRLDSSDRERRGAAGRAFVQTEAALSSGPGRIVDILEDVVTRAESSE